ncbi:MAG TPA: hypothetical protein VE913_14420 [Longimicrobium sp.]|nr:hypothetical protein [Longimicrobium sp.]
MSTDEANRALVRISEAMNGAVRRNDADDARRVLAEPLPDAVRAIPTIHARLRRRRGNTFSWAGEHDAAHAEYSAGFADVQYSERGDYLLDWAMASVTPLFLPGSAAAKRASCRRCIHTLDAAGDQAAYTSDAPYLHASVASVRAFIYTYLGETEAVREQLRSIVLPFLPPEAQQDVALDSFHSQVPKALFAALELRSAPAVRPLCAFLLSSREASRMDVGSLSLGVLFATVVARRMDTPKFARSLAGTLLHVPALAPTFPVTRQLAQRMSGHIDPARIASFVDSACR